LFKEHFLEAFRAASGASHTWAGPEAGIGTRMLAAGLEDAQGRVTFAFADDSPLGWIPAAARDLRTLQTHWNKLAGWRTATRGARASPARDPRVGQAPPSERFSGGEVKL
jgi:hypothetical protein